MKKKTLRLPKLDLGKEVVTQLEGNKVNGGGTAWTCIMPTNCQPCNSAHCPSTDTNCTGCSVSGG